MSCGATPARSAVSSSAREETSARAPRPCSNAQTLMFGFALSEKNISIRSCSSARSPSYCRASLSPS